MQYALLLLFRCKGAHFGRFVERVAQPNRFAESNEFFEKFVGNGFVKDQS